MGGTLKNQSFVEQEAAREGEARPQDSEVSRHHTTECNDFTGKTLPTALQHVSRRGLSLFVSPCLRLTCLVFKKQ